MQIPLAGQSYEHSSQDINFQKCINLFPTISGPDSATQLSLIHTPGLLEVVDIGGTEVRAIMPFDDSKAYAVVDNSVYSLTMNWSTEKITATLIGTIVSATGHISFATNPTQVMIVDGTSRGYIITAATDTLAEITDTDFLGGLTVAFMDSYFVFNVPNSALMYTTALNDGSSIDALDVSTAEGSPDNLQALIVDKRELWAIGEKTTEVWYNAANATGFPFSPRNGALIDQGTEAPHSAIKIDNTIMWLDDRRYVIMVNGYQISNVTSPAIAKEFQSYTTVSDAFAYQYSERGHTFYVITFPTEKKTWAFDVTTQMWHERAGWTPDDKYTRHQANCHAKWRHLNLVGGYETGKIYALKDDVYTDDGNPIHRERTTGHNAIEMKQLAVNELELHVEAGKGTVTGTGNDPQIMFRYSHDGGYTWSYEMARDLGELGNYNTRVRWNRLGSGREWLFEFKVVEPVPIALIGLYAVVDGDMNA